MRTGSGAEGGAMARPRPGTAVGVAEALKDGSSVADFPPPQLTLGLFGLQADLGQTEDQNERGEWDFDRRKPTPLPLLTQQEHPNDTSTISKRDRFPCGEFHHKPPTSADGSPSVASKWPMQAKGPETISIPAFGQRLRCLACGSRKCSIRISYAGAGGLTYP